MLKTKDHENYDYIEIIVKKENVDEVVASYGKFLWKELSRKEDRRYNDVIHLSFYREHNIPSKDRLQLLQVYYEFTLNERSEAFDKKHHKSNAGICNLVFFTTLILVGLWWFIFYMQTILAFIGAMVFTLSISLIAVFFGKKLNNLRKKESKSFKVKEQKQQEKIQEILREVETLTSVNKGGEL